MKTIVFTHRALKLFEALPGEVKSAVAAGLDQYAIEGRGDVKALRGSDLFRLRIGRYRVLFAEDRVTVLAVYVGTRETTTYAKGRS